jgi:hypothetical protein
MFIVLFIFTNCEIFASHEINLSKKTSAACGRGLPVEKPFTG